MVDDGCVRSDLPAMADFHILRLVPVGGGEGAREPLLAEAVRWGNCHSPDIADKAGNGYGLGGRSAQADAVDRVFVVEYGHRGRLDSDFGGDIIVNRYGQRATVGYVAKAAYGVAHSDGFVCGVGIRNRSDPNDLLRIPGARTAAGKRKARRRNGSGRRIAGTGLHRNGGPVAGIVLQPDGILAWFAAFGDRKGCGAENQGHCFPLVAAVRHRNRRRADLVVIGVRGAYRVVDAGTAVPGVDGAADAIQSYGLPCVPGRRHEGQHMGGGSL